MKRRRLPIQCAHGFVSDWGDFGRENAEPEPCPHCPGATLTKEQVRDLVYRGLVKRARANEGLRVAVEQMGFFRLMGIVDGIADSIFDAYEARTPLTLIYAEPAEDAS